MTPLTFTDADLDIAVRVAWGEARNQPREGQKGVLFVLRNRATWDETLAPGHPEREWWGTSIAKVCEHPYQFSCLLPSDPNYTQLMALSPDAPSYLFLQMLARNVFQGAWDDPTRGSTTYKVTGTKASWDAAVVNHPPIILGAHSFWRLSPSGPVLPFIPPIGGVS